MIGRLMTHLSNQPLRRAMNSIRRFLAPLLALAAVLAPRDATAQPTNAFEFRDGDRVVMVGDTLIERERDHGIIEHLATTQFPDRHVTFRNLGWSADTPQGQSRVSFDHSKPASVWFQQLTNSIAQLKPSVVLLGYGMANSFQGETALPSFIADLTKLMDAVQHNAGTNALRWIILGPVPHEPMPAPLPDPAKHNAQLAAYSKGLRELATQRQANFVNLYDPLLAHMTSTNGVKVPLTDNGIHLNAQGYRLAANAVSEGLGWKRRFWRYSITPGGKIRQGSSGAEATDIQMTEEQLSLLFKLDRLELPPWLEGEMPSILARLSNRFQILGLKDGAYDVLIDGQYVQTIYPTNMNNGIIFTAGPILAQAEELRQVILKKNELFFHRWRPQNTTYLTGFRSYEQGQNAKELPQFEPLIEAQEKKIAALRSPRAHKFEVTKNTGATRTAAPLVKKTAPRPIDLTPMPHPKFDVDANLEISLYAENPLLAKPIHMNFDERGRLWVASSEVYPQIKPGQPQTDKIIILEDADGDGKAEKSTLFADGLLIPTGILPGDGGAYIGASTELLHMKDTDGDGMADQRRVVLGAFGTEDTHHILHTLRWGQDGQLYMNQSIYIHTHAETPHGVVRLNSGGILNLRVPTMELGVHMKGIVNSWGHVFDDFGQSFATDGASAGDNGLGGLFHIVPQAMYFTYAGARRILESASPGSYPKFASLEYIRSSHFPDDWQGGFVTCDFRAHRIVRFGIDDKGSSFVTREMPDLVRTKDVAFRPIDIKLGPDGALYIADWSNPIIQHGEVDFRDPRRDQEHGRIWRVTYKGRKTVPNQRLETAANGRLLNNLASPELFVKEQSRRLLKEKGAAILPELKAWTARQTAEPQLLEALWLHQAIDNVEPQLLEKLLTAQDGKVRSAAVRVLALWQERLPASAPWQGWSPAPLPLARAEISTLRTLELLAPRIADEHPRVRLEALRALARIPTARAAELALSVLDKPLDPKIDYALWLTINDLAEPWLAALKSGAWKIAGREKQLEFGLKAVQPAQASAVLGQLIGEQPLPKDGSGPWIDIIGQAGTAKELRRLLDQVLANGFDDAATARALAALNQAARLRNLRPESGTSQAGSLLTHTNEAVRLETARLVGAWKNAGKFLGDLAKLAGASTSTPALREAAFASLREIGGQGVIDSLTPLTTKETASEIRRPAVIALAGLSFESAAGAQSAADDSARRNRPNAAELRTQAAARRTEADKSMGLAVAALLDAPSEADALALWRPLLNLKGAASAFARTLPKSGIPQPVAKAGLRAAREGGRNEPDLILAITRGGGLDEGEVTLTDAEVKQLVADIATKGDPARGEIIYRKKELSCVACHAIGGAGGKVGPDMTSIGASAPVDYLIESVWFPNKKIKEGYHAVSVETKDSEEYSGVLVLDGTQTLTLRDATGKEISIPKNNVAERRTGTLSLMPAGLLDALSGQDRVDLFRFLSELGKPGPFDATKGSTARTWRVRYGQHTDEQVGEEKMVKADVTKGPWTPLYANVDGRFPGERLGDLFPHAGYARATITAFYAAARLQLERAGKVTLKLTGADTSPLWINGESRQPGAQQTVDLPAGLHTITVRIDPKSPPAALRVEASEGTFLNN